MAETTDYEFKVEATRDGPTVWYTAWRRKTQPGHVFYWSRLNNIKYPAESAAWAAIKEYVAQVQAYNEAERIVYSHVQTIRTFDEVARLIEEDA